MYTETDIIGELNNIIVGTGHHDVGPYRRLPSYLYRHEHDIIDCVLLQTWTCMHSVTLVGPIGPIIHYSKVSSDRPSAL